MKSVNDMTVTQLDVNTGVGFENVYLRRKRKNTFMSSNPISGDKFF